MQTRSNVGTFNFRNSMAILGGCIALASLPVVSCSQVIDGTFDNWTTTSSGWLGYGTSGVASGTQVTSGGNPGEYYAVSNVQTGFMIVGQNIKQDYTNTNALNGDSWTLSFDAQAVSGFAPYINVGLAVQQGSSIFAYQNAVAISGATASGWTHYSTSGSFGTNGWYQMEGNPANPTTPSFSSGVTTKFGFYTQSQTFASTFKANIDNYLLTSTHLNNSSVPEPGAIAAGAAGALSIGGMLIARRRRRTIINR